MPVCVTPPPGSVHWDDVIGQCCPTVSESRVVPRRIACDVATVEVELMDWEENDEFSGSRGARVLIEKATF